MAAPIKPQKKSVYGKRRLWLVDTIADPAAPTVAEVNAGDYLGCFPLSDQGGATATPNKVTLPVLLCETETEQDFGTTTHEHADLNLVWDPQAASASAGKKAWDLLKDGYEGNIVWETGIVASDDDQAAAGEFVTVVPAKIRVIGEDPTSTGEDGIAAFQAAVVVRAPYTQRNVAIVA